MPADQARNEHRRTAGVPARVVWLCAVALAPVSPVLGDGMPKVTIKGGSDISAHNYSWTITHDHDAPLVYVEIPHFRVDLFNAPQGWTAEIINQNSLDLKPGKCIAEVTDPSRGLKRGESAKFGVRVNPAEAPRGEDTILLRFADGVEVRVTAVVPVKPSSFEQWAPPAVLAVMFGAYVLIQAVRKRRGKPSPRRPA